jgi:glutamyl-tRNA synthetase
MPLEDLAAAFTFEGVNRANAVVNFSEEDPFDPKAVWLNSEHVRALPVPELAVRLLPVLHGAGFTRATAEKVLAVTPLIRERIKLLNDAAQAADFFFLDRLPPYDVNELVPPKGDLAQVKKILLEAQAVLATTAFDHAALEALLRSTAERLGVKAGPMFTPIRVAVCGRRNAPPLFETMAVLGRELCLQRIAEALTRLG